MSNIDYESLYKQYKAFLYKLSLRYSSLCAMDDLMQMAYFGLHSAASNYKEDYGVSFMHYLAVFVKRAILRELDNTGAIIRIPAYYQAKMRKFKQARQELAYELLRPPLTWEIASKMQASIEDVTEIERLIYFREITSLDKPVGGDDNEVTLSDISADSSGEDMTVIVEQRTLCRLLWEATRDCLSDDVYQFICEYYQEEMTLVALANRDSIAIETLKSNMGKALRRLRNNRRIRQLGADLGYVGGYRHVTLSEYHRTWTSATESEVLNREDYRERLSKEMGLKIENYKPFSIMPF